jgi:hypothetical protein
MNIFTSPYYRHDSWRRVKAWFNPRQKWLTKAIGNTWMDLDGVIETTLFECIKRYVEAEEGLIRDWTGKELVKAELERAYKYAKHDRPLLQKELDESYPKCVGNGDMFARVAVPIDKGDGKTSCYYQMKSCEELYGMPYEEAYREVNRLEQLIKETDDDILGTIVKYREYMWT